MYTRLCSLVNISLMNPLNVACAHDNMEMFQIILDSSRDINVVGNENVSIFLPPPKYHYYF